VVISHSPAFTAQGIDDYLAMTVLPAALKVDLPELASLFREPA
jgi:hypothetical protein